MNYTVKIYDNDPDRIINNKIESLLDSSENFNTINKDGDILSYKYKYESGIGHVEIVTNNSNFFKKLEYNRMKSYEANVILGDETFNHRFDYIGYRIDPIDSDKVSCILLFESRKIYQDVSVKGIPRMF